LGDTFLEAAEEVCGVWLRADPFLCGSNGAKIAICDAFDLIRRFMIFSIRRHKFFFRL
jgi:hypothetical protein